MKPKKQRSGRYFVKHQYNISLNNTVHNSSFAEVTSKMSQNFNCMSPSSQITSLKGGEGKPV